MRILLAGAALLCAAGQALAHGALVDLSVYDRTEGRRLAVYWHEGRAYVVGKPGNEYQVMLRNRLREDLLAIVSVDGVNVITGQSADPSQRGYVLAPHGGLDIQGWRKNMAETAAFYFTAPADSYAARTGRPQDVGAVGVALFRRKSEAPPAPISSQGERSMEDRSLGTGHGRREHSPAISVTFERATRAPAELVTLYYDSYQNLLARGVIREPVPVVPHRPRTFPGFVPDPQG